jgi:hypothetical protein
VPIQPTRVDDGAARGIVLARVAGSVGIVEPYAERNARRRGRTASASTSSASR